MRAAPVSRHQASANSRPLARRSPVELDALVLDLLALSNQPISAYDISGRSIAAGRPIVPNQVYRTLARLMEQGLVHRIESLSAYMVKRQSFDGCLICDQCHAVQCLSDPQLIARLSDCAHRLGFAVERTVVEMHGHCSECAADLRPLHDQITERASRIASPSPPHFGV